MLRFALPLLAGLAMAAGATPILDGIEVRLLVLEPGTTSDPGYTGSLMLYGKKVWINRVVVSDLLVTASAGTPVYSTPDWDAYLTGTTLQTVFRNTVTIPPAEMLSLRVVLPPDTPFHVSGCCDRSLTGGYYGYTLGVPNWFEADYEGTFEKGHLDVLTVTFTDGSPAQLGIQSVPEPATIGSGLGGLLLLAAGAFLRLRRVAS